MASWMIHLRVAQQLYRQLNIESINEFVLGNIAPDSGIPSKDGSGFIPDAAVSHFRSLDENGIKKVVIPVTSFTSDPKLPEKNIKEEKKMTLAGFLAYVYVYGAAAVSFVVANWAAISMMLETGMTVAAVVQWILQQI